MLALLAGDRDTARSQLGAAEHEPDPAARAITLVEALIWLHALLDAETSAFPNPIPE